MSWPNAATLDDVLRTLPADHEKALGILEGYLEACGSTLSREDRAKVATAQAELEAAKSRKKP